MMISDSGLLFLATLYISVCARACVCVRWWVFRRSWTTI